MCKYVNMRALVCVYVYISSAARFVSILFSYSFVVSLSLSLLFQNVLYCLINDDSIHIYIYIYCISTDESSLIVFELVALIMPVCILPGTVLRPMPGMIDDFQDFQISSRDFQISSYLEIPKLESQKAPNPNYSNILAVLV